MSYGDLPSERRREEIKSENGVWWINLRCWLRPGPDLPKRGEPAVTMRSSRQSLGISLVRIDPALQRPERFCKAASEQFLCGHPLGAPKRWYTSDGAADLGFDFRFICSYPSFVRFRRIPSLMCLRLRLRVLPMHAK